MEKTLKQKMAAIAKECGKVVKDSKNPHFKNTYASLDAVMEFLQSHLDEHNLSVVHQGSDGQVVTKVLNLENDEQISSLLPIPQNLDPQKVGSCVTYYRRYNLCMLFNLLFDKDDDGNVASNRAQDRPKQTPTQTQETACIKCNSPMKYFSGKKGEVSKKGTVYQKDWAKNFCTNEDCRHSEFV